ncbi:hypothetical protein C8A03DRAFT_46580 [Achaetomium macrosporum]|uniref:Amidase domain-containing protein n=1 Tax=Achaetomium macrosporum TaxID=79813 RepID=A0AAN7C4S7_9PEZI|nr:hypothetical protein C8A03DRAFT_46580 [Achaetomium macrosporum]
MDSDLDIIYADATELAQLIRTGKVSPIRVVEAFLARIQRINPKLNAIVTVDADTALREAQAAEAAVRAGRTDLGPLHGVPFTVKDSIDTAGVPTQRGSPIFAGRIPTADATAVARMKAAGAILLAKTNLPEFSLATDSDSPLTGRTNNPWDLRRTPGGSSGGEAAAIAAGLSPLGLGTDLAISVRGPAAHAGIVALKPTLGRIPMTGVWPRAPRRFWHVGPMARTVRDVALAYAVLAGPDGKDGFSSVTPSTSARTSSSSSTAITGVDRLLRVGWLVEPGFGPVDSEVAATVEKAAQALQRTGRVAVARVRIPALEEENALDVFMRLLVNEVQPVLREATAGQPDDKIFAVARGLLQRPATPTDEYVRAEQAAERLRDGFAAYFQHYDALLCPVLPISGYEHAAKQLRINQNEVPVSHVMSATVPLNVTGLPGLSMRFGTSSEGMPINVQIVGSWYAESTVLHVASLLEGVSAVKGLFPKL